MKRWLHSILCLGLVVVLLPLAALADGTFGENSGGLAPVEGLAIERLATRNGPATKYRDTGTYRVAGESVRIVSLAYDDSGLCWVQCEILYGNKLRRVYTGLKRFDTATFDLGSIPEEDPLDYQAEVSTASKAMYGPGDGYGTYAELTVDAGQIVTIVAIENDYAQVEWVTSEQSYRVWVSVDTLRY